MSGRAFSKSTSAMLTIFFWLCSHHALSQEFNPALDDWRKAHHVEFKKITPTKYQIVNNTISAQVESSGSALVLPFSTPRKVSAVRVKMTFENAMANFPSQKRVQREGDDFILRVGLLMHGKAPWVPFIAPEWVKMLQSVMIHPSDKMIYQVAAMPQELPAKWVSPYSDSVFNELMSCHPMTSVNEWECATRFELREIVGLWLMADGDDLKSKNSVVIKSLVVE